MYKQISLVLFGVFVLSVVGLPPIPCPGYFSYVRSSRTKEIMGRIELPYEGDDVLYLEVNASMTQYDRDDNTGPKKLMKLELYTPSAQLMEYQVDIVTYLLRFPDQQSIPQITVIIFNDMLFCHGPIPSYQSSVVNLHASNVLGLARQKRDDHKGVLVLPPEGTDYYYPLSAVDYSSSDEEDEDNNGDDDDDDAYDEDDDEYNDDKVAGF